MIRGLHANAEYFHAFTECRRFHGSSTVVSRTSTSSLFVTGHIPTAQLVHVYLSIFLLLHQAHQTSPPWRQLAFLP